jgi:hypothetical protein
MLGAILLAILIFIVYFKIVTRINPPTNVDPKETGFEREKIDDGFYRCNENWLRENEYGLWELYIEGKPFELGLINGLLTAELVQVQEDAFVDQIKVMIPSESYLKFLKYFTAWFNKDLDSYIKQEYLLEIYGVSVFASDNYGFIGDKYDRILNYHAAHDIGHALQNLNLVKCTAFGVWDEKSVDSTLLIGRNFDFYVGDSFAENKIVAFVNPDQGYKFASITWGGMIGVVSGMNEKGLTVSLNSAKSEIPFGAKTPVSIIAREILQYASNIEEAMAIASERRSFVSESFLIGSAYDHKAVVIEKSSDTTVLYDPDTNNIILTNHFQSDHFKDSPLTVENMENETSVYRHERVLELIEAKESFDYLDAAVLLRDRKGKDGKDIGQGNEKAINQLIAHHSIIFKPEERRLWISTAPYQMGSYLCYNLDSIFLHAADRAGQDINSIVDLRIPPDTAYTMNDFNLLKIFRSQVASIKEFIAKGDSIPEENLFVPLFLNTNPDFYYTFYIVGRYYQENGNLDLAVNYYNLALEREVSSADERREIEHRIEECKEK